LSVTDLALIYSLVRDIPNGLTVLQDTDANGNLIYEGVALAWNADPAKGIWWVIKYSITAPNTINKYQYSPPNQIWNNRAAIFP
jgi:hypothetical protein